LSLPKKKKFKGYDWKELLDYWHIHVDTLDYPEFEGESPDFSTMNNYPTDGGYSWSEWFKNDVSESYKQHLDEIGAIDDHNEEQAKNALKEFLFASIREQKEKKINKELRAFIKALAKESKGLDDLYPIWKALLKVEYTETLFHLVLMLLPAMYT
jgi:hypothetical protein